MIGKGTEASPLALLVHQHSDADPIGADLPQRLVLAKEGKRRCSRRADKGAELQQHSGITKGCGP